VLPKPGVRRLAFAGAMRKFSQEAAGAPIVALARNEIIHHETAIAVAIAFAAAAIAALFYLRDIALWVISLVPLVCGTSLSAAVVAASGQTVPVSALAAAMAAMAVSLSSSIVLVSGAPSNNPSIRAAVLPPLAYLGAASPLMMSAVPAVAAFGKGSVVFLIAAMAVNLVVVPQALALVGALRQR